METGRAKKTDEDSPRNRKIIYLMHKRKEIALRRARPNSITADSEGYILAKDQGVGSSPIPGGHATAKSKPQRPSFFSKVASTMSKVFSLDQKAHKMASTLAQQASDTGEGAIPPPEKSLIK